MTSSGWLRDVDCLTNPSVKAALRNRNPAPGGRCHDDWRLHVRRARWLHRQRGRVPAALGSSLQPVIRAAVPGEAGCRPLSLLFRSAHGAREARAVLRAPQPPVVGAPRSRQPRPAPVSVIAVFDIEHLSAINDAYGRHVGDLLLQCVADRLKRQFDGIGPSGLPRRRHFRDVLQRRGRERRQEGVHEHVADRLFSRTVHRRRRRDPATVKMGVASYPQNGGDANTLVQNAEAALSAAKGPGEKP